MFTLSDTGKLPAGGIVSIDRDMHQRITAIMDNHFPLMAELLGVYGLPRLLVPVVNLFKRYFMSATMRKRFLFLTKEILEEHLDRDHIPVMLGGKLETEDVLNRFNIQAQSLKDCPEKWNLEKWEVDKVIASNNS